MILPNQNFIIKINKNNIDHFHEKGYENIKIGDKIEVKAEDLTKGSKRLIKVKCDYCGEEKEIPFRDYHDEYGTYSCKHCRQTKTSKITLKDRQDYLYNGINTVCHDKGYKLITSKKDLISADTRVKYICPLHGNNETKAYTLFLGHGCPICAYEQNGIAARKSPNEVYDLFFQNGSILLNKEDYVGWNEKNLKVICNSCGEIFLTSYSAFMGHYSGQVCPKCASNISRGENKIKTYLENNNISFYMQYRFDECKDRIPLPFDFYLYDINMCIEYDGEGHYKPIPRGGISNEEAQELLEKIQYHDKIKNVYCQNNNIRLLRIPYWKYNEINEELNKNIIFT